MRAQILAIIVLMIVILLWVGRERLGVYPDAPFPIITYGSGSPTVVIMSGMHGNEPAGATALNNIREDLGMPALAGTLIVLPKINVSGHAANRRETGAGVDLNRSYPGGTAVGSSEQISDPLAAAVWKIVSAADFVLDFHEGWGYHTTQPQSVGSTISGTPDCAALCVQLVSDINVIADPNRPFVYLPNLFCDITSTMACQCYRNQIPYILVETTGQNNVQPLEVRVAQIQLIVVRLMQYIGLFQ
jgi:predicted deacylase